MRRPRRVLRRRYRKASERKFRLFAGLPVAWRVVFARIQDVPAEVFVDLGMAE